MSGRLLIGFLLLFSVQALATHVAVLETIVDQNAGDSVSLSHCQFMTNVLREQAVKELPAELDYIIMPRQDISGKLPSGKSIESCEGGCLAEMGRNISADYISQVRVGRFGDKLTLSAELYETSGSKLIASFNGRGTNVEELLELVENKAPLFFRRIKELTTPELIPKEEPRVDSACDDYAVPIPLPVPYPFKNENNPVQTQGSPNYGQNYDNAAYGRYDGREANYVGSSIPANVKEESWKHSIRWVPLTVSAVTMVTGTVVAFIGNGMAKDAADKEGETVAELKKNKNDAESGQNMRSMGIFLAIAGAVGVVYSLAF